MNKIKSLTLLAALLLAPLAGWSAVALPDYAPAPPDNPLKGFVPYAGQAREFPHSLEFNYLPVRAVMKGPDEFDWQPLERLLADVASRGCQTVFRFYLEYPNKPVGVPQFLLEAGVRIHTNTVGETRHQEQMLTPDYEDLRLRAALTHFIAALGARYDGDARIGFITAGLLGKWGEWHDYLLNKLWASQSVQREVMDDRGRGVVIGVARLRGLHHHRPRAGQRQHVAGHRGWAAQHGEGHIQARAGGGTQHHGRAGGHLVANCREVERLVDLGHVQARHHFRRRQVVTVAGLVGADRDRAGLTHVGQGVGFRERGRAAAVQRERHRQARTGRGHHRDGIGEQVERDGIRQPARDRAWFREKGRTDPYK